MHIKQLILPTTQLKRQKEFYTQILGLSLTADMENSFSFLVGSSILTFQDGVDKTRYHFAFNIPSDSVESALEWTIQHHMVLSFEGKQIVSFPDWNAHAIYFYDADKNIVEFIARKNLNFPLNAKFNPNQIIGISEIGIPTRNVNEIYRTVNSATGAQIFSGDKERFCAIGSETGLLIAINYHLKKWIPTMEDAYPYPLKATLLDEKGVEHHLNYKNEVLTID